MPKRTPVAVLSDNLRTLMERRRWSGNEVARRAKELAMKPGESIDAKTVNNMRNGSVAASLDSLHIVARVFGLQAYELLIPNFAACSAANGDNEFEKIVAAYTATDETGRHSILSVAEMAARYTPKPDRR